MTCDLPELAIQKIVQHLADDVSVHSLVSLASLSRSWRSIVRQTPIATLKLDSAQDLQHPAFLQTDPLACKFLRVDLDTKTAFFTAAAKLLKRHSGIQLKGQAITDSVLAELARGGAENLTSAIIEVIFTRVQLVQQIMLGTLPLEPPSHSQRRLQAECAGFFMLLQVCCELVKGAREQGRSQQECLKAS